MPFICSNPELSYVLDESVTLGLLPLDVRTFVFSNKQYNDLLSRGDFEVYATECFNEWLQGASVLEKAHNSLKTLLTSEIYAKEAIYRCASHATKHGLTAYDALEDQRFSKWVNLLNDFFSRADSHLKDVTPGDLLVYTRNLLLEEERRVQRIRSEVQNTIRLENNNTRKKSRPKKITKPVKKAFLKSVSFLERVLGKNNVELFLKGNSIEIKGKEFNWVISRDQQTNLLSHTAWPVTIHIPYKLEVYDKDGIYLGKGCVYFEQTPVLDQIAALALFIKSENEEDVLKEMNFFDVSDSYFSNKVIKRIKKPKKKDSNSFSFENIDLTVNPSEPSEELVHEIKKAVAVRTINPNFFSILLHPPLHYDSLSTLSSKEVLTVFSTSKLIEYGEKGTKN